MDADYYRLIAEIEDEHWWFVGRRRILSSILESLNLSTGSRILDVGCGPGGNLAMLADHGIVTAVEMDRYARDVASARGICDVVAGSLPEEVPFEPASFQLVTAFDVIEHIDDDRAALESIRDLLAPGGHLIVTVPAYRLLWSRHDVVNQHRRRYTRTMLSDTLRSTGYEIERASYFNTMLFPVAAPARLLGRLLPGSSASSGLQLPPAPINRFLAGLFAAESHLLKHFGLPFGLSVLAVAYVRP